MAGFAALVLVVAAACQKGSRHHTSVASTTPAPSGATTVATSGATTTSSTSADPPTSNTTPTSTTAPKVPTVLIDYRVERRSTDSATAGFEALVEQTLTDARGWPRAGFTFERQATARFSVILAEPDEAEALCRPYDVFRKYSCQNGPVVVINADRWRHATPEWTGDLATYRTMLVNHEVGHLLGMHHPKVQCPSAGVAAAVMAQQSTELNGCLPNGWPLAGEIAIAGRHDLPLAPPFER
jgi:hypothetical protein